VHSLLKIDNGEGNQRHAEDGQRKGGEPIWWGFGHLSGETLNRHYSRDYQVKL
jgi:hypothetical protein